MPLSGDSHALVQVSDADTESDEDSDEDQAALDKEFEEQFLQLEDIRKA